MLTWERPGVLAHEPCKWSSVTLFRATLCCMLAQGDLRSMLLLALLVCLDHVFFVENPGSSCLGAYPRFQWLFTALKTYGIPATCAIPYKVGDFGKHEPRSIHSHVKSRGLQAALLDAPLGPSVPEAHHPMEQQPIHPCVRPRQIECTIATWSHKDKNRVQRQEKGTAVQGLQAAEATGCPVRIFTCPARIKNELDLQYVVHIPSRSQDLSSKLCTESGGAAGACTDA